MPRKAIQSFTELPVQESERSCNDKVCAVLAVLLALVMLISAGVHLNLHSLYQINYPTDSDNRTCGYQLPQYPYMYFTNPSGNNIADRVCVSVCPKQDEPLMCSPTSRIRCSERSITIYESNAQVNRLGGYCLPKSQTLMNKVMNSYNLHAKWNFLKSYDVIKLTLLIALIVGVIFLVFVQFLPSIAVWASVGMMALMCFILSFMMLSDRSPSFQAAQGLMNGIAVCILLLGLVSGFYIYWMRKEIRLCTIFIRNAARFLAQCPSVFGYIFMYIMLSLLLIVLFTFQYMAFSSVNPLVKDTADIFWQTSAWNFWNVLNILQLIWGISFLRDSFNFIVSGNAVDWYFRRTTDCPKPLTRMLTLNFGSVALGSFLNGFLFIPELLVDICNPQQKGPCGFLASPFHCMCGAMLNLFELVRQDAYAYINLTGAPYCTAASSCEYLCHRSDKLRGGQSANRIYRLTGHIWLLALLVIIGYSIDKSQLLNGDVSPKALLCILGGGFFMVTYFVLIHSDSAEGLLITFLAEEFMANQRNEDVTQLPQSLRQELNQFEIETAND